MTDNQTLQKDIHNAVDKILETIREHENDLDSRIDAIRKGLAIITQTYTTEEYSFNLAMEIFVEAAYTNLSDCLETILNSANLKDNDITHSNINFATYYALSLIRKKEDDLEALKSLIDPKYQPLSRYPLYYEVHSRYYKRANMFREALNSDKRAINILQRRNITNIALCISYASTVCTMLKKNIDTLQASDIDIAKVYIEQAIEFNPEYPKYFFLKAQIIFLSTLRNNATLEELEKAAIEAKSLIEHADTTLWEIYQDQNIFLPNDRNNYDEFEIFIEDSLNKKRQPRFPKSNEELDLLKEKILSAENQDVCASSSLLPPIPLLRENDKYFFICYSSVDFKSVYSDLIELYKHKVPFKYDERLTHGLGWQDQIAKGIGNENCAGVIFYLSKNVIARVSIYDEIKITKSYNRDYFCVNLEGSTLPSRMLADLIVERYTKDKNNYAIEGELMKSFLDFFGDNQVFTHKFKEYGPNGTLHFDSYIDAIINKFPKIIMGD